MSRSMLPLGRWARVTLAGLLASAFSTVVLVRQGRKDTGSGAAPVNAISHWLWPHQALQRDDVSMRHTLTGAAIHTASTMFWAWLYEAVRARRTNASRSNALSDAVVVTAVASAVDLKLVPGRLSPGFERRLQPRSTLMVYVAFAAGLALAGLMTSKDTS